MVVAGAVRFRTGFRRRRVRRPSALVAAFLVATPLGQTADARKCGPGHCHPRIYCDDAGVSIEGTDSSETVHGTSGTDIILAKAGDDIIYGGGGDDVICGGDGKDTIFGQEGDDIIYPNKGNDIVDGGPGEDAIAFNDDTSDLEAATTAPFQFGVNLTNESGRTAKNGYAVVVDLEAVDVPGSVCATIAKLPDGSFAAVGGCARNDGYGGFDQILADASGMSTIEDVTGSFFPQAGSSQPLVNGLLLRNYLMGNGADNYLSGSGGVDYLAGHSGEDTADYWNDSPGISVDLSSPCPGSIGGCGTDGRGSKDTLFGIEDVNGTRYDDHLIGDSGANVLDGGSTYSAAYNGNDVISGGSGDDVLLGGTGTNALDGGSGTDLADYSNEPGLGGINVDLSVIGPRSPGFSTDDITSMEGVIGTLSADTLVGDSAANVLNGGGGDDLLSGGGAPGGQDKDVLVGGSRTRMSLWGAQEPILLATRRLPDRLASVSDSAPPAGPMSTRP